MAMRVMLGANEQATIAAPSGGSIRQVPDVADILVKIIAGYLSNL
jgi:hypothetical protein